MPILVSFLGISTASPLIALVGVALNGIIVAFSWRKILWKAAWRILLASTLAMPLGLWIILYAPEKAVKLVLGIFLILYGLYSLLPTPLPTLKNDRWAYFFGFLGGILGSAYNVNGPPVLIYGTMRRWPPEVFRATLNGYFFPSGIIVIIGHCIGGLWTGEVWTLFLWSLPALLIATWLGTLLNRKLDPTRFNRVLYVLIFGIGLLFTLTAI